MKHSDKPIQSIESSAALPPQSGGQVPERRRLLSLAGAWGGAMLTLDAAPAAAQPAPAQGAPSRMREIVNRADYPSEANFNTARQALSGGRLDFLVRANDGATDRLLSEKLSDGDVCVFDYMSRAQVNDVLANTAAKNLAAALDVTAAISAAVEAAAAMGLIGKRVYLPTGSYKITGPISSVGANGNGQVAIVGSGEYSTRIFPAGDFTAVKLSSNNAVSGGFTVEWPATPASNIPDARIGVEFAGANNQSSLTRLHNIIVRHAWRGFVLQDWTGKSLGTMFMTRLEKLTAFRCADWGFYLNSKVGSTTLVMDQCYVRGDSSSGAPYGKGMLVNNFNDLIMLCPAIDQCLNAWLQVVNCAQTEIVGLALESNRLNNSTSVAVTINAMSAGIYGVKLLTSTLDTGGPARIVNIGGNCKALTVQGFTEQANKVAQGTTKYKFGINAPASHLYVIDGSVLPDEVHYGAYFANAVFEGVRLSMRGIPPNYGTWSVGKVVKNGMPAAGQARGWVYATNNTWLSEGNF